MGDDRGELINNFSNTTMKKITSFMIACVTGLLIFAFSNPAVAEDKEVTIKGEAKCAKCSLKEAEKCQTVIVVGIK